MIKQINNFIARQPYEGRGLTVEFRLKTGERTSNQYRDDMWSAMQSTSFFGFFD